MLDLILVEENRLECAGSEIAAHFEAAFPCLRYSRVVMPAVTGAALRAIDARLMMLLGASDSWQRNALDVIVREQLVCRTLGVFSRGACLTLLQRAVACLDEFLLWPAPPEEFRLRAARLLESESNDPDEIQERLVEVMKVTQLVGQDPAFEAVVRSIRRIARCDAPVLILGETGTGKELCAQAVHHLSRRRSGPFIPVDCGSIPDHLFENEMFGHVRGAYTDAKDDQKGMIALAQGGTLFLDEVDALSLGAQAKLLRFLQERRYRALGSERYLDSDVNIIAASNRRLKQAVDARQFRADLFFRLDVLSLTIPALRDRPRDIRLLAHHFVRSIVKELRQPEKKLTAAAITTLESHSWPGNVRELRNVLQRACSLSEGQRICASDLELHAGAGPAEASPHGFSEARAEAMAAFERNFILRALQQYNGNITQAARSAGKERRAFGRLVKKYAIKEMLSPMRSAG